MLVGTEYAQLWLRPTLDNFDDSYGKHDCFSLTAHVGVAISPLLPPKTAINYNHQSHISGRSMAKRQIVL